MDIAIAAVIVAKAGIQKMRCRMDRLSAFAVKTPDGSPICIFLMLEHSDINSIRHSAFVIWLRF
jgi:hypothetical protein